MPNHCVVRTLTRPEPLKLGDAMKGYLLDTCTLISMFRGQNGVREHIQAVGRKNCWVSEISIAELYFGLAKGADKQRMLSDIQNTERLFKILPAAPAFREYGEIRYALEHQGRRIDQFDLLIGATALHSNLTVVTSNIKHFERIEGLTIENWAE